MGSPSIAEKILRGVITPVDKEKVEKLTLDQTATRFFYVIGQVSLQFCIQFYLLIFYTRVVLKKIICSKHLCSALPL